MKRTAIIILCIVPVFLACSILYKPISQIGTDGVVIDTRGLEFDSDDLAGIISDRMSYHRENRHP